MTKLERAREIVESVNEKSWDHIASNTYSYFNAMVEAIAEALPNDISDEEIEESCANSCDNIGYEPVGYVNGARWAREKILGKE